jgi:O-antigen ligase
MLAAVGLFSLFSLRRAKPQPNQLCFFTASLFFGYVLARAILSPDDYLARPDIYSILAGLLVYFFVATLFTEAKRRMIILCVLLALALVHVVIGAVQFRDGENFMLISFLQRYDYGRRASGFYVCPNHLAGLLEVLGIFGVSMVCWSRWPALVKLLIGYATAVCYAGVILTGSRGGYLSTAASFIVFIFLSVLVLRRGPPRLFWRITIPGSVLAILLALSVVLFVRKSDFLSGRAQTVFETTNMRFDLWKGALEQWRLQPVLGTGSGSYLYYGRQFRTDRVQEDPVYVHNDYLHLLAEYGLIGVALLLPFLAAHLWNGWKNFKRLGPKRVAISHGVLSNGMALQIGALASLCAYIVHSVLDFNLHIPANVLLLAFVFGILANAGIQRERELAPMKWPALSWRLLLPALGVLLAIQCVRLLPGEYYTERARIAVRDNEPLSAILLALQGLRWEQKNPNLYRYLGSARIDRGDEMTDPRARASFYEAAVPAFEKGRALLPRDKTFAIGLGTVYDELGRFQEGEWMFGEALALDPRSVPTRNVYEAHLRRWRDGNRAPE